MKVKNDGSGLGFKGIKNDKVKKAFDTGKATVGLLGGAGLAIGAVLVHGLGAGAVVATKVANKATNTFNTYVNKHTEGE